MTAWVKKGSKEEVGIITDFVDPEYVISTFSQRVIVDWLIQDHCFEQAACRYVP
jgi:hypothetical protein